jgi:hypothetical protein
MIKVLIRETANSGFAADSYYRRLDIMKNITNNKLSLFQKLKFWNSLSQE